MPKELDASTPLVIIEPKAYLKMLKHVLRWGSMGKKKSQFKECMGMIYGKLGDQKGTVRDVIVTDVVEFTHGGHIEVAFEDQDYVSFAEIDAEKSSQGDGVFNVGWYHSHPGLSVFLSTVDVRNHLSFQTRNPSAIAIVWDHLLLEEDGHIGFETFRLTELAKGQYSDYASVKTIVNPPSDLNFYKEAIKDVMDNQQGGNPPMFEINELPNIIGDYEPSPIESEKFEAPTFSSINDNSIPCKCGDKEISPEVLTPISKFLNEWVQDLGQSLKNKGVVMNQNFSSLKEIIEKRVKDLQMWFNISANEIFLDVWEKVDTPLEDQIEKLTPQLKEVQDVFPIDTAVESEDSALLNMEIKELLTKIATTKSQLHEKISKLQLKETA